MFGHHAKAATKAITWRFIGAIDTFMLAFLLTGHLGTAGSLMGVEVFTKSFLYYGHEQIWSWSMLTKWFTN
jgi:uncharacterized membrane protein